MATTRKIETIIQDILEIQTEQNERRVRTDELRENAKRKKTDLIDMVDETGGALRGTTHVAVIGRATQCLRTNGARARAMLEAELKIEREQLIAAGILTEVERAQSVRIVPLIEIEPEEEE